MEEIARCYRFSIDVSSKVIEEVLSGVVTYHGFCEMILDMFQHPDFGDAMFFLCDYRAVERFAMNEKELERIADQVQQLRTYMPEVKLAFVTGDLANGDGSTKRFIDRMRQTRIPVTIEKNLEAARSWLLKTK